MRFKNFLSFFATVLVLTFSQASFAVELDDPVNCAEHMNGTSELVSHPVNTTVDDNTCKTKATSYKIKLHGFGICKEAPTTQSYLDDAAPNGCLTLYWSDAGKDLDLNVGFNEELTTKTIPHGEYKYAYFLMGQEIKIASLIKMDTTFLGRSGQGTWCWTLAGDGNSPYWRNRADYLVECGEQAGTPGDVVQNFSTRGFSSRGDMTLETSWTTGFYQGYLMKDKNTMASLTTSPANDATMLLGFGKSVGVVDKDTKGISIDFDVSNAALVDFGDVRQDSSLCGTTACVRAMKVSAFNAYISFTK